MGLTIHYSLRLPAKTLLPEVRQKLGTRRQHCLDLPFQEVSDLLEFEGGEECNFDLRDREDPLRWFLCQADTHISFKYERLGKPVPVQLGVDGSYGRSVLPEHVIGFSTYPGNGCEEANVGLSRFPRSVIVGNKWSGKNHRLLVEGGGGWTWHSFCKTQYSNSPECGGLENFVRCHLSVVAMLDAAKQIGFEVEVHDEGQYWEKRDIKALIKEIGEWDKFIAGFGGALKDVAESAGMKLEAPIFARKDFEQLEMEGQALLPTSWNQAVRSLVETTAAVKVEKLGN